MRPTPEIIELAKRFHAAGGCEEHKWHEGDWLINRRGGDDYVELVTDVRGFGVGYYEISIRSIPILDESELWARLARHCELQAYHHEGNKLLSVIEITYPLELCQSFKAGSLHAALYEAACFVQEQKEK